MLQPVGLEGVHMNARVEPGSAFNPFISTAALTARSCFPKQTREKRRRAGRNHSGMRFLLFAPVQAVSGEPGGIGAHISDWLVFDADAGPYCCVADVGQLILVAAGGVQANVPG